MNVALNEVWLSDTKRLLLIKKGGLFQGDHTNCAVMAVIDLPPFRRISLPWNDSLYVISNMVFYSVMDER